MKFFIAAFPSYLMLFYVDLFLNGSFAVFFLFCNRKKTFFFFLDHFITTKISFRCVLYYCVTVKILIFAKKKNIALHTHGVLALLALLQRCHIKLN